MMACFESGHGDAFCFLVLCFQYRGADVTNLPRLAQT